MKFLSGSASVSSLAMGWWLLVVIPPAAVHLIQGEFPGTFGIEILACLAVALLCVRSLRLRQMLQDLPRRTACLILVVAALPWSAQLVSDSDKTYPALHFGMYCQAVPPSSFADPFGFSGWFPFSPSIAALSF